MTNPITLKLKPSASLKGNTQSEKTSHTLEEDICKIDNQYLKYIKNAKESI